MSRAVAPVCGGCGPGGRALDALRAAVSIGSRADVDVGLRSSAGCEHPCPERHHRGTGKQRRRGRQRVTRGANGEREQTALNATEVRSLPPVASCHGSRARAPSGPVRPGPSIRVADALADRSASQPASSRRFRTSSLARAGSPRHLPSSAARRRRSPAGPGRRGVGGSRTPAARRRRRRRRTASAAGPGGPARRGRGRGGSRLPISSRAPKSAAARFHPLEVAIMAPCASSARAKTCSRSPRPATTS
jgi:hypothetical protein